MQYRRDGFLHRGADAPAFEAWLPDGTPAIQQWWVDGRHRGPDRPAVIVFGETGDVIYTEFWQDHRVVRRDGDLGQWPRRLPTAAPEEIGQARASANYLPAELRRIWHRTCLALRDEPDVSFLFRRGQPRPAIDRLLAYFPFGDEVAERIHHHLNFTRSEYPTLDEVTAAAIAWCEALVGQAREVGRTEEAAAIESMVERRAFEFAPAAVLRARWHDDARERDFSDMPVFVIGEYFSNVVHHAESGSGPANSHAYRFGGGMLVEALYQIATHYELQRSLMAPMAGRNLGFDAWADLYRLGGMIHAIDDRIHIGYPDPDDPGSRIMITNPETGERGPMRPG